MPTEIDNPEFSVLKADVEAHRRLCGYYIIDLVSIRDLRARGESQESILEILIDHFDDESAETDRGIVTDEKWSDYEVTMVRARAHAVESLVGGHSIGHSKKTMSESTAADLFGRFVAVCGANPRFCIGLGIGNREYVFTYGALIVADDLAGILWIVEGD